MDLPSLPGLAPFLDPLALAIVGGGTVVAVVLRTKLTDLARGIAALRTLGRRLFDTEPLLTQIAALERIARRHGVIALDRTVIEDPDARAAVAMVVDGKSPDAVAAALREARTTRFERHSAAADMWTGAAELAPSMGMIGTLIGLVEMFTAMRDPAAIGGAMAIALLTTLYGAVLASLVALPIAARLRRQARHEALARARIEAPLMALAALEPVRANLHEIAA